MAVVYLTDIDLKGKKLLIRQDLNTPLKDGVVSNDRRIIASLLTIQIAVKKGAKVILMSHLGRPTEGKVEKEFSLLPVAQRLSKLLGFKVRLVKNWLNGVDVANGEVVLCENVRFNKGEKANDTVLAKQMALLCDIFVMDAFASAHRIEASTYGVAQYAKIACCGALLSSELEALGRALKNPKHPMVAIVGGSKVSTKLCALESLAKVVDKLIVGGGIANTFFVARGYNVGKSLYEPALVATARKIMSICEVLIPTDVVCGTEFCQSAIAKVKDVSQLDSSDMIFDIGPNSVKQLVTIIKHAGTIVWNGPVGVFEFEQFGYGTKALAQAIAEADGFSIAGGGDTIAAVDKYKVEAKINYICTGGGAFLEFLKGKKLPAVAVLEQRAEPKKN